MVHIVGKGAARSRRPAVVATAAVTLLFVAACGSDDNGGGGDDEATGDVSIRFAWWGNPERDEITNQAIEAFEAEHPNIDVEGDSIDFDGYFDRLATEVAAGNAPDVITLGGAYPREYGDRGALLDLSEVEEHLPTDNIDEAALSNGFFSGVQYSIPTGVNTYAMVVNPDVFSEAGVPLPDDETWTWDDYVRIAEEISANTPDGTYGAADRTAPDLIDLYSRQNTGDGLYTEDGQIAIAAETAAEWWQLTTDMMESGATPPASITSELAGQPGPEQTLMGQGLAGMQFDWSNQLPALRSASGADLQLMRAPGESHGVASGMWLQASQSYGIYSGSDHPEEAAQLIDFLVNHEEAAQFIKADRGLPANSEVLAAITPELDDDTAAQAEFIAEVEGEVNPDLIIGPEGSTESVGIVQRLNDEVLFGRITPEEAGQRLVDELNAAIS
ncbi:ABC transporter substrate-binding protein [Phytoactinopolyspora halotolerans]|uniref:Sugar ABC transporter substrate-binding protein n=1 Tax=Phytoactinopolyspora halotolerans TaxID=1981512 RepID=A0A6L9SEK2_9ACTN|nr:sugar ABC transporter substrate-binding protein [Phytoactinopolyspora halotolerans]NEE02901.1 sugar ABC transporter substrate-binding protein [Phytoactinopolyspora halotolerans]